jgi:hypothetical protein
VGKHPEESETFRPRHLALGEPYHLLLADEPYVLPCGYELGLCDFYGLTVYDPTNSYVEALTSHFTIFGDRIHEGGAKGRSHGLLPL